MRCDFIPITFEEALEHVVLSAVDGGGPDFESEPACTAILELDEPMETPCPHVEHDSAD